MAAGISALRRIQIGLEDPSAHGTAVAATARLIGKLTTARLAQKNYQPDDLETALLASYMRSTPVGREFLATLETDCNYEQVGYLLGMAIIGAITPSGSSSLYTWTYTPNYGASNVPNSLSLQYGDDVQAFLTSFLSCKSLTLSAGVDDAVRLKAELFGRDYETGSFTGALTNPTVLEPASFGSTKLYVDSSWSGIGGTQVVATIADWSWKLETGFMPMKYGDGNLYFTDLSEKKRHVELEVTLAFTSGVAGYFATYRSSGATLFVRIKTTGSVTGAGNKSLALDGCYVIAEDGYSELQTRDGQDVVKLKLVSQYDVTGAKDFRAILINGLSVMP